ncbi:MAG: VCBS repeat-containing protein, partial [Verrucomicrobiales bacterium]|nr:VCBS repeat-containing protein [Verrucomicrobiales bacterium]
MPQSAKAWFLVVCTLFTSCDQKPTTTVSPPQKQESGSVELGELPNQATGLNRHERLADEFENLDPGETGWESEAFSEWVSSEMKAVIAAGLTGSKKGAYKKLGSLLSDDLVFSSLRPSQRPPLFESYEMAITQSPGTSPGQAGGIDAFEASLKDLGSPIAKATSKRVKFKVMHVEQQESLVHARMLFEMSGKLAEGWFQANAVWHTDWTTNEPYQITSVRVEDYREAAPGQGKIEFVDIAPQVLAKTDSYADQLAYSFDYWRTRSDRSLVADLLGAQGVVVADVNGDLLDDVYVLQPGGLPNRLFLHQPDGTARDFSEEAGVAILDFCRSALLIDLDNDDDQDLVVGLAWSAAVFENDGTGKFSKRTEVPSDGQINSMAAADYDGDGDVDFYLCGRDASGAMKAEQGALGIPMPYYDANNGGPNTLLRNDGGFAFVDVTKEVGMDTNNRRFSLACAWEDFDNDGDQDLYVSNDFGRNNLFRNDGETFTDIAVEAGVVDIGPGMSAAWGDHNGDGWMDLYIGNMWSSAGNRITLQKQFLPGADDETRQQARRHARGNSVYVNNGDSTFRDVTHQSGANMARWAWSSNFIDLNNDGAQDLAVAN